MKRRNRDRAVRKQATPPLKQQSSEKTRLRWPKLAIAGGLAAFIVVSLLVWQSERGRVANESANNSSKIALNEHAPAPPLPEVAASPYRNTDLSATYVGSEACRRCHADQYASYLQTGHSESFAKVDPANEPPGGEFERQEPGWIYRAYHEGSELRHQQSMLSESGERVTLGDFPVAYLMGSGRFARSYLIEREGVLVESPLTWYASTKAWQLSPGYERTLHSSFCRNVGLGCTYCHVGRAVAEGESEFHLTIHETAIGCERCHGPGSLHVESRKRVKQKQPAAGADLTIVNPSRLSRELAESICNQCHLETEAQAVVRGRRREDFRPGLRWSDFVVNYAADSPNSGSSNSDMTVTGHVQQLRLSRCYQASETLTCITCHDPHDAPPIAPRERIAHHRAACLACHEDQACRLPPSERQTKNGNDCANCHMPPSDTNVPHVAFTHHRIGIHNERPAKVPDDKASPLVPVLDVSHLSPADRDRTLGLAYMRLAVDNLQNEKFAFYSGQSEELLRRAAEEGVDDSAVLAALAIHDKASGDLAASRQRAEAALADPAISPSDRIVATHALATLFAQEQQFEQALPLAEQLTKWRAEPGDWFLLAACRSQLRDLNGAIAALEQAIELDPTLPHAYQKLAELYQARGDSAKALQLIERMRLVEAKLNE